MTMQRCRVAVLSHCRRAALLRWQRLALASLERRRISDPGTDPTATPQPILNQSSTEGTIMLRNIPANLSPELVRILMEMGHGDEILLADANFPGHHLHPRTVRADGLMIPDLLRSILTLMPLDRYSDYQVALMETVGDDPRPPVWDVYEQIWTEAEAAAGPVTARTIERMAFYEHTPSVYAVVLTGETALYGNLILKKGVL